MSANLKDKYFVASRGFYGTNSVTYNNMEMEVTKFNHDYANPVTSFNWGTADKASNLLAFAILHTIASPTIARVYANKYTQHVIQNLHEDEWKMEALEVARWINANTDYAIEIDEASERKAKEEEEKRQEEALAKEQRRIKREEEFQRQVQEKLAKRSKSMQKEEEHKILNHNIVDKLCKELHIKSETLSKILDVPMETINNWRLENEMPKLARKAIEFYKAGIAFKEQNSKQKIEMNKFQEDFEKHQTEVKLLEHELERYKKLIHELDIPALYQKYKKL